MVAGETVTLSGAAVGAMLETATFPVLPDAAEALAFPEAVTLTAKTLPEPPLCATTEPPPGTLSATTLLPTDVA